MSTPEFEANFPSYLRFKPAAAAVELHSTLEQALLAFEHKLKTTNNMPVKALAEQHVMPIVLLMHQWFLAAHADMLEHVDTVTAYLAENSGGGSDAIDPDLLVVTIDFLTGLKKSLDAAIASDPDFAKTHPTLAANAERAVLIAGELQLALESLESEDEDEEPSEDEGDLFEDDTPAAPTAADTVAEGEGGGWGGATDE